MVVTSGILETMVPRTMGKKFYKVSGHEKADKNITEFQIWPTGGAFTTVNNKDEIFRKTVGSRCNFNYALEEPN